MSPWTALLQSLHSALIDEVTDRHPEPKPELGLPKKFKSFQFPFARAEKLFWVKTSFPGTVGASFIAYENDFFKSLGLTAASFWEILARRAVTEFTRRKIEPIFEAQAEFENSAKIPADLARLSNIVWIPIVLPAGECWLGIGI
jgi:hypothetical protein